MKGSQSKFIRTKGQPKTIRMPKDVCIYSDDHCMKFVSLMREMNLAIYSKNQSIILDFSQTENMTAGAAVMLFAEVTRAQLLTELPNVISILRPTHPDLWELMRNSGLWEAIKPGERKTSRAMGKGCPFASGNDPDKHLASTLASFRKARPNLPTRFDSAIQEAILNVVHHAYVYNQNLPVNTLGTRWWQYAAITKEDVRFTICDLGVGIPNKILYMPENRHLPHGNCIEKAMEDGFSTLFRRGRGMGSKDLKRPVVDTEVECLSIFSNNGIYSYVQNREPICGDRPACLPGTVVEWKMNVSV